MTLRTVDSMDGNMVMTLVMLVCACGVGLALGYRLAAVRVRGEVSAELAAAHARLEEMRVRLEERVSTEEYLQRTGVHAMQREADQHRQVIHTLAPVTEKLNALHSALARMEEQRSMQYGALDEQMRWVRESEQLLRSSTQALVDTLSHSSVRGSWGEAQLRSIVEAAGMLEYVHFMTQVNVTSGVETGEKKRKRPDMVVMLPGGKSIPVDAKVPFDSYMEAQKIPLHAPEEDARRREDLMKAHVQAVRRHVDALAAKEYWREFPVAPDYVIAFIPAESLLSAALSEDPTLLNDAFERHVVLASPTTLWAVLRTVAYTWRQETLSAQAQDILNQARELYARMGILTKHAEKVTSNLAGTVAAWNSFVGSYETRALSSARKLASFDQMPLPEVAQVEAVPRTMRPTNAEGEDLSEPSAL
jgi:Uncharacterized protein conserved in bacteria